MTLHQLVDKAKWLVKDYALGVELPRRYAKAASSSEVDPKRALFIGGKQEAVPDSYAIIMPYLESRYGMDVRYVGLGQQEVGYREYNRRCLTLMDELARAAYVFLDDASDVVSCVDLRPDTKVAQLWHACGAFKKWGMSTGEMKFGNTAENIRRHPFYGNLSVVTVSSPDVAWAYREAMMLEDAPETVRALGVSRTDAYFDQGFADASHAWLAAKFPQIAGRKVALYAPTFRGTTRGAKGPDALDFDLLKEKIGAQWALVVKHHPFVKEPPAIPATCSDFAFMATSDDPTDALLVASDAMVTDYSSVVFEYSLLNRPMAFFAYDLDDYNDWRGFYYDYEDMTPGPVMSDAESLADFIAHAHERFDFDVLADFRERFMSACDGHATERICAWLMHEGQAC